jgi:hypothetical protein
MAKKWIAINLLLLVIAGLLGWELRASILRFIAENDLAKIRPARSAKPATIPQKPIASKQQEKGQNPEDFSIIPNKTLFSDVRGNEIPVEAIKPPEPPPLTPKPILVGIIMIDNQYKALVIDPAATSADKRRPEPKRIGDVYRGFTITAISADRIVLENGTRREIIPLHEGTKKGPAAKTAVVPTRVIAIGGSATSGGAITVEVVRSGAAGTRTAASPSVNMPPAGSQYTIITPGGAPTRSVVMPTQPQSPKDTPQPVITQPPSSGTGTRVIRSPFGDIIRPN